MENPIKMDDLGVPLCLETPVYTVQKLHLAISGINYCNFQKFFLQQYESLNISKGGDFSARDRSWRVMPDLITP